MSSLRLVLLCLWTLLASLVSAAHQHGVRRDDHVPYRRHIPYKRQAGVNVTALNDTIIFANGTVNATAANALDFVGSTVVQTSYIEITLSVTQTVDDGTVTVTATGIDPNATGK